MTTPEKAVAVLIEVILGGCSFGLIYLAILVGLGITRNTGILGFMAIGGLLAGSIQVYRMVYGDQSRS